MADSSQISNSGSVIDDLYILNQNNCDLVKDVKEDMTVDELRAETEILEHPINWTDPIVWHDPTIDTGVIVKLLETDIDGEDVVSALDHQQTSHNIDAVYFPLIKINQYILSNDQIIFMKLESTEILPTLSIRIIDTDGKISKLNSTGLNNSVIVVITAPLNGVYRKIKLQFYIIDVTPYNSQGQIILNYNCVLKVPELTHKYTTSMNYPNKKQFPGCTKCEQPENEKPNSWEMLHFIANHCKLGFASTKKCKDISDRSYRLLNSYKNLEHCLYKEKEFAGTDEESAIFDWWIDFYNYIVMVNVPYVLNDDIDIKHLGIYSVVGIKSTTDSQKNDEPKVKLVNRTLSNSKKLSSLGQSHNLMIRDYKVITNNDLYNKGTCSTNNIFMPKGAGGSNGVDIFDVQTIESSVSGEGVGNYTTKQTYLRGIDMSGFGKYKKATIFSKYFQNKRSKMLVVELEQHNLGLQRGTLLNIVIVDDNARIKSIMMNNPDNLYSHINSNEDPSQTHPDIKTTGEEANDVPTNKDIVTNNSIEMINYALSGLYYIDGITFEYDNKKEQKIYQTLYLIKKGDWANYTTANAPLHINKNITASK